jgi:hypothetical protein
VAVPPMSSVGREEELVAPSPRMKEDSVPPHGPSWRRRRGPLRRSWTWRPRSGRSPSTRGSGIGGVQEGDSSASEAALEGSQ